MTSLRRLGVRIALDDFGTGFSTLTWLQRLPVDRIKVDRSFTATIDRDLTSAALVRGVMALGEQLGLEVVAEGVKTEAELAGLRAAGCHLVQGYLFGAPAPAKEEPGRVGASRVEAALAEAWADRPSPAVGSGVQFPTPAALQP